MNGVGPHSSHDRRDEQLIAALVPPPVRRAPPPMPLMFPRLPSPRPPPPDTDPGTLLLDIARLDSSGRFTSKALLNALHWCPGDRLELAATGDAVILWPAPRGRQRIGARGEVAVPAATRALVGLQIATSIAVVAAPGHDLMIVHAPSVITRLLAIHYACDAQDGA